MRLSALACLLAVLPALAAPPARVLFLGNSYTYYNNLPEMLTALSGGSIEASMVTQGGSTLMGLWLNTPALATLRGGTWDYVVLQDQSTLGLHYTDTKWMVNEPRASHTWARYWDDEIQRQHARTVFYLTWARRDYPEFQTDLNYAYASIARERKALLAPAGLAWARVREAHPEMVLFDADGSHPAPMGTYLTACVFLETLTGRNCTGGPREVSGHPMAGGTPDLSKTAVLVRLTEQEQRVLAEAASAAVADLGKGGLADLPAPDHGKRVLPKPMLATDAEWSGIWRGPARLYRAPAAAMLELTVASGQCRGFLTVSHPQTGAEHKLPLAVCVVKDGTLEFETQDPRFVRESFQAVIAEGELVGLSQLENSNGYERLSGSFQLRKQ